MPRFLEGKAGAKSLCNQFGGVAAECHIFCGEKLTTAYGLSQVHNLAKKNSPAAQEVASCGANCSFSGGFEEVCLRSTCHRESSAHLKATATATLSMVCKIQQGSKEINVWSRKSTIAKSQSLTVLLHRTWLSRSGTSAAVLSA